MSLVFDSSHNIYFISGSFVFAKKLIDTNFPSFEVITFNYDKFGIDESRNIQELLSQTRNTINIFCIVFSSITKEAENSLLKILEELDHAVVFFVFPEQCVLLPTVVSRGVFLKEETIIDKDILDFVKLFMGETIVNRQKLIEKKIKELENNDLRIFLFSFIQNIYHYFSSDKEFIKHNGNYLQKSHQQLSIPKMSPKQIFDFLAISLKK